MSRLIVTPLHCVARTAPSLIVLAAALAAGAAPGDPADAPRNDVGIKISDVEREITSLRGEDRSKSPHAAPYAEKLAGELQRLRDEWEGRAAPAAGAAGPELYVVGFYEGSMPDGPRNQLVAGTWDSTAVLLEAAGGIESTAKKLPYVAGF